MIMISALLVIGHLNGLPEAKNVSCDSDSGVLHNCYEEFTNAAKKVFHQENEGDRAQTATDAARNCYSCAAERLNNDMREFSSPTSGDATR